MTENEIDKQLANIGSEQDLMDRTEELIDAWDASNTGVVAVNPVLKFMEAHPEWDYGLPGPFVHFVERFYRQGYEQALVESIGRRPTPHTVWMLNRVINGEKDFVGKMNYLNVLLAAKENKSIDSVTFDLVNEFLAAQEQV
jgi:hypothetical protein